MGLSGVSSAGANFLRLSWDRSATSVFHFSWQLAWLWPAAPSGLPRYRFDLLRDRRSLAQTFGGLRRRTKPDCGCRRHLSARRSVDPSNGSPGSHRRGLDRAIARFLPSRGNMDSHLPGGAIGECGDARPWGLVDRCPAVREEALRYRSDQGQAAITVKR
jgi:hypothetical protein